MKPLVHCITNYVAMNFTANALLAVGTRPIMSFCPEEMDELVSKCCALMINIGCIDKQLIEASEKAVIAAKKYNKPWVLDPVGVGLTQLRTETCKRLIALNPPAIIRGNKAEITALGNINAECVVVTSGQIDLITKTKTETLRPTQGRLITKTVTGGHPIMADVTAMGCVASAICAAMLAKGEQPMDAACHAMLMMGKCGERAAAKCLGTGSFNQIFIDELYNLTLTTDSDSNSDSNSDFEPL